MSDGLSEANTVARLTTRVENAAFELRETLAEARGRVDGLALANEVLERAGYRLVRVPGGIPWLTE
jgi:hypothetical protein